MHIPDGFIPLWQCVIYFIIAAPFVIMSIRWANRELDERKIPFLGVLAASIFAIQAMNIPIPWGTSGHMVGAAMAAIILGSPFAGILLLTLVLVVQALLFGDGGITVLGANILNMGVVCSFIGFYGFKGLRSLPIKQLKVGYRAISINSFTAAWASLFLASLVCAVQLWLAGTFPLAEGLLFMGLYHFVIGLIAEGVITSVAIVAIVKYREELFAFTGKYLPRGAVA